jgi:xanthine dehydrogenase FAD-binding subunit
MSFWSNYVNAGSIAEALDALASAPGPARPISGGTDLLLELQSGRHSHIHTLVDVTHIPELNALELRGDTLFIGAAVPVRELTESPLVRSHALAVSEACGLIGGPQVRNTATLGGNVAHALPAADGMIALCAMDTQVEVVSAAGCRLEPILSLFKGPGVSALQLDREFVVGFHLPARQPGQASAFERFMRPQGVALPIINNAVWIQRAGDCIQNIRIAIGPSGPVPQRVLELEQACIGSVYCDETLARVKQLIRSSVRFRSSPQRATAEYRYQLSEVLLESVIRKAWQRCEEWEVA